MIVHNVNLMLENLTKKSGVIILIIASYHCIEIINQITKKTL